MWRIDPSGWMALPSVEAPLRSDSRNGSPIYDELGAMNRRSAIRGQIGDKVGDLVGFGRPADRNAAQTAEDNLARIFNRAAIGGLQTPQ